MQEQPPRTTPATARYVADRLLVKFRHGTPQRRQSEVLAEAGVRAVERIAALDVVVVHMDPPDRAEALVRLRGSHFVVNAEKDAVLEAFDTVPNDADWSAQWGLRRVGLPGAWDRTHGSNAIVVAVLDTGVDAQQQDLQGAILPGYSLLQSADDNGHGTAVAGIIAARADNREGIAGVCWTCSILPIKVLDADGTGDTARVAGGIVRAADLGARVISMSLGGPGDDLTLDQAVAYAQQKGAILVAAAGNHGTSAPFYPAAIPGVIGVAATDETDRLYSWSNFGSWVQVAAPGCNAAPALAGGYVLFCGTSSATPVVAGLLALELSTRADVARDEVINALESTTVPLGDVVRYGRIDATAALAPLAASPSASSVVDARRLFAVKSSLTRRVVARTYRRSVDAAAVTVSVTFSGARTLQLSIRTRAGGLVAKVAGTSPLRISRRLTAGMYAFTVGGRKARTSFELVLSSSAENVGRAPSSTSTPAGRPE
jgi:subtilisin family serine protease